MHDFLVPDCVTRGLVLLVLSSQPWWEIPWACEPKQTPSLLFVGYFVPAIRKVTNRKVKEEMVSSSVLWNGSSIMPFIKSFKKSTESKQAINSGQIDCTWLCIIFPLIPFSCLSLCLIPPQWNTTKISRICIHLFQVLLSIIYENTCFLNLIDNHYLNSNFCYKYS